MTREATTTKVKIRRASHHVSSKKGVHFDIWNKRNYTFSKGPLYDFAHWAETSENVPKRREK